MDARAQQDAAEEALRRSLSLALRSKDADWYRPTLTRAKALAGRIYRDLFGVRMPTVLRDRIAKEVEAALKGSDRSPENRAVTAQRVARGIAAYIASAVLDDNTPSSQWEKVWRTRMDPEVRDSHRAVEGQVVDGEGHFTVGGHKMFGPGDISAPVEEWINCRCYPEYRRRTAMPQDTPLVAGAYEPTGALVAAVSTMSAEGFLAVSAELFDEAIRNGTAVQVGVREDGVVLYDLVAAVNPDGFVIVGLPAESDPIWQVSSEQPPHVTVLYLSVDFMEQAAQILAGEAPKWQPVPMGTRERDELGDDGAQVVHLEPGTLADIRTVLTGYEPIQQGMEAVEQYPEWQPHLTLGYPETPPLSDQVPATITIDRLAILDGAGALHSEYALGEPMDEQPEVDQVDDDDEFPTNGTYDEVPLYGVLAPEGVPTGDKRGFTNGSLTWTDPPLSLRWMRADGDGHSGSVVTGRIDRIWREDGLVKWEGMAAMSDEADEMVGLIADRHLRGVSVDLDDATVEMRAKDGSELALPEPNEAGEMVVSDDVFDSIAEWVTAGRVRSAAVLPIPAYPEAFIAIGTWAEHEQQPEVPEGDAPETVEPVLEEDPALVAAAVRADISTFAPGTQDGPGWLTHPVDTDRLRDYWVHGKGAAKIGWGLGGDFNRCRALLAEYIKPQHLAGYCANRHKDALGFWPGEHRGGKHSSQVEAFNLVASGMESTFKPPGSWFEDPQFIEPTGFTIVERDEATGLYRCFGHAAEWDTCHTGFADRCVSPPSSPTGYSRYHLGYVLLDDGTKLATGSITMGTGHAPLTMSSTAAAAHYDNTGTQVAQVRMGEDAFGIWFAGVLMPDVTPEQVFRLRASKISGDWRGFAGELDAIAMLAVNVPGFPVQRPALVASAGERTALVAAGVVACGPTEELSLEQIVNRAVSEKLTVERARFALRDATKARRRATMSALVDARRKGK